jgi:hypothetical protein
MYRRVRRTALVLILAPTVVSAQPPPSTGAQAPAPETSAAPFDQVKAVETLRQSIAGKEDLPAGEVFKNIQRYKGVTAARLLRIMDYGFTRSLGVDCTHCHVPDKWDLDDKDTKKTARAMSEMMAAINNEYLKKIPTLNSSNPSVNCTTCHRGQKRPALELPRP